MDLVGASAARFDERETVGSVVGEVEEEAVTGGGSVVGGEKKPWELRGEEVGD